MEGAIMAIELNQNLYLSFFWCFIFFLVFTFKLTRKRTKLNLPPSPPKLPFIGNLHQIRKPFHLSLRSLSHKYGSLMLLHLGQVPTVVVSSADIAREMAKTNNDIVFSSRPSITAAKIHFYGCNDVIFAAYGEGWKQRRKISITEFLSPKKVKSFQYISEEEVSNLVNKIRDEACKKKNDGLSTVSVNLTQMLIVTLNNILCRCIFGHKYETLDGGESSGFREIIMKMMHEFGDFSFGNLFPSLWWMDFAAGLVPKMKATSKEFEAFIDHEIERQKSKRRNNNTHENKDLLDTLLQLQQDGMIDSDSIKAIIANMFGAGIDTTSTTMEWAMAELMKHTEKMKRTQEEVRGIVGNKARIEETDVNQMSYLKCVVKETLRLHPHGLIPRKTNNSSVKLGGYDIPPKTNILVNPFAIHRDPNHWERPEEFVPERFQKSEVDFKGQDFEFIPFGFGRRGCPGLSFGVVSLEHTVANLLYWFDWKLHDDYGTASTSSVMDIDMSEVEGQAVRKKVPLLLQPIPHSFCPKT